VGAPLAGLKKKNRKEEARQKNIFGESTITFTNVLFLVAGIFSGSNHTPLVLI
jgi:hypothetical protein